MLIGLCVIGIHSASAGVTPLETINEEWKVWVEKIEKILTNNFRLGSWNSKRITLKSLERSSTGSKYGWRTKQRLKDTTETFLRQI